MPLEQFKHFFKIINVLLLLFAFNHHIVNIHLQCTPNLIPEHPRHHLLISSSSIL